MSQYPLPRVPDYIICAQCNLHKKAEANTDLALYVNYLLKGYHISSNNVVGGMLPFNKNFTYKKRENDFIKQNSNSNEVPAAESSSSTSCRLGQASRPTLSSPPATPAATPPPSRTSTSSTLPQASPLSPVSTNVPIQSNLISGTKPKSHFYDDNLEFQMKLRKFLKKGRAKCDLSCSNNCNQISKKPSSFIVGIQEPSYNLKSKKIPGLNRSNNLIYCENSKLPIRAALWISSNLNAWKVDEFTSNDIATARVDIPEGGQNGRMTHFYACSVYMDILDKKVINTKFAKLVAYCQETGSQLVSFMDTNSHNGPLWGNDVNDVNPRGRVLGDYI